VTVPHPRKDIAIGTLKSIERQSGVKLRWEVDTMPVAYYPAIIEKGKHGFSVFFPDLPGCTSAGDTIQESARNAEEALRIHLEGMIEDDDPLPAPSPLDAIERDPEVDEAARVLVRADLPGKSLRLNISMDEGLIEAMDAAASAQGMNRSAYLASLVRADLKASARQQRSTAARPSEKRKKSA
jgi:predicted RNase H-like HicB family nuclease